MARDLDGTVALVTGGGRGIGRAVARALAEASAAVAVLARHDHELAETVSEIEESGGRAAAFTADVTARGDVARAVRSATEQLGAIDLLINNAGSCGAIGPLWEADPEAWWRDVESSVRGSFLCARAVLPSMITRRQGRIVNISSYVAVRPSPYLSGYAAAKTAILSLTEALAAECGEYGIHAFALTPGPVQTELTRHMLESHAGRRWLPDTASKSWIEPERTGKLVVFLASGAADGLSGRFLHVLDDVEELARRSQEIREADLYALRLRK